MTRPTRRAPVPLSLVPRLRTVWPGDYEPCVYAGSDVFYCCNCAEAGHDQHTWRYKRTPLRAPFSPHADHQEEGA